MQANQLILNINSENADRLVTFYRDVVGLPPMPEMGPSSFNVGGAAFVIDGHSEVKGTTREPQRVLINFMVDDLAAEQSRLERAGVQFIRKAGREEWGGVISTFLDPDGNYAQLLEYKPPPG
jgi:predicted enzyme related to lactoylglutathione lyase